MPCKLTRCYSIPIGRRQSIRSCRSSVIIKEAPERIKHEPMREEIIRFTGFLPEDHAWSQAAYRLYRSRHPVKELQETVEVDDRELMAAAADREAQAAALRAYPDILGPCNLIETIRPPRNKNNPQPLFTDMEVRWRETTHTVDRDVVLTGLIIKNPSPVWQIPPLFKQRQAAAAAKVSRVTSPPSKSGPSSVLTRNLSFARNSSFMKGRVPQDQLASDGGQPVASPLGRLPSAAVPPSPLSGVSGASQRTLKEGGK